MDLAYPFDVGADGTTATAAEDRHLRDLVEQLLFTVPGERVNRPELGSGLLDLVFEPASDALAAGLGLGVQATLQQYLGDRLELGGVAVENTDGALRVTVTYRGRDGRQRVETFVREAG